MRHASACLYDRERVSTAGGLDKSSLATAARFRSPGRGRIFVATSALDRFPYLVGMCLEIFGTHFEGDDVVILELIIWIRIANR